MRQIDSRVARLVEEYGSEGRFIERLFVPSQEALDRLTSRARAILSELQVTEPQDRSEALLIQHWVEVLDTLLARMEDDRAYPFRYVSSVTQGIASFVELDARPIPRKIDILRSRMDQVPLVVESVCCRNADIPGRGRNMTVETLNNAASLIGRMSERVATSWLQPGVRGLLDSMQVAREACLAAGQRVRALPEAADPIKGLPYGDLLDRVFGASVEELAARTKDDVRALLQKMRRAADEIRPGASPGQVLREDFHGYGNPESMLYEMKKYVAMTREMCVGIVDLPAEERCVVTAVPDHLQDLFPWGGYSGPDGLSGHLTGYCYVNTENLEGVNRGWLMNMALHEAYPGHHAQYVCASGADVPRTAKTTTLYSRASHASEGMAHRSEDVYQGLFDDPLFSLFVLYRRLHTAVRILCELELNYSGKGDESALALYSEHLGFDEATARGQIRLQHMWRGYMTSYFTGYRKLAEIQETAKMGDDAFTRLIFSAGFVSLSTLEALSRLPAGERERARRGFPGGVQR